MAIGAAFACTASWKELNEALLKCDSESELRRCLTAAVNAGKLTRSIRVYGRLSYVRRRREVEEVRAGVETARAQQQAAPAAQGDA